jgi:nucleoside phosphorylase
VICAGAAGSLVPELSVGDVAVGTETVEHDYRLLFATAALPELQPPGRRGGAFRGIVGERRLTNPEVPRGRAMGSGAQKVILQPPTAGRHAGRCWCVRHV